VTQAVTITYQGSVPIVGALRRALEGEGVAVSVRRCGPHVLGHHEARTIAEPVVAVLSVEGRREAIEAGVRKFRANFPSGRVEVEGVA
jgi:hypothetical protein